MSGGILALADAFSLALGAIVPGEVPLKQRVADGAIANEHLALPVLGPRRWDGGGTAPEHHEMRERLDTLYERAESPIERYVAPWLLRIFRGWPFSSRPVAVHVGGLDHLPDADVVIVPQLVFGDYRLDFGIIARVDGRMHVVALECDGAEYHDLFIDQVRDAYLALHGFRTVRATGRDILSDPESVAKRVWCAVVEAVGSAS